MLENIDLNLKLPKDIYKTQLPRFQQRLFMLQKTCLKAKIPTLLIFEGWDGAGKTNAIELLTQQLDSRDFQIYKIQAARTYETHMPWLWRFWLKIPEYGHAGIFNRSWYHQVLQERSSTNGKQGNWHKFYRDIVNFERTLADDGYVIIKFFLHISKREQKQRFHKLKKNPLTGWEIHPVHWERHRKYHPYTVALEEMFKRTHTNWAPWTIVEATQRRWAQIKIFKTVIGKLEQTLSAHGVPLSKSPLGTSPADEEMEA